jgi:hypothetical protein
LFVPGDFYINGELDIVVKFAVDSLLEEKGFEPLVPSSKRQPFRAHPSVFRVRLHRLIPENDDFGAPGVPR